MAPGFAAGVILTLSLGIGASTAIFSLAEFMFSLPVASPGVVASTAAAVVLLAAAALMLPARRAMAIDPTRALKLE